MIEKPDYVAVKSYPETNILCKFQNWDWNLFLIKLEATTEIKISNYVTQQCLYGST